MRHAPIYRKKPNTSKQPGIIEAGSLGTDSSVAKQIQHSDASKTDKNFGMEFSGLNDFIITNVTQSTKLVQKIEPKSLWIFKVTNEEIYLILDCKKQQYLLKSLKILIHNFAWNAKDFNQFST